jgi:hypothetical protein
MKRRDGLEKPFSSSRGGYPDYTRVILLAKVTFSLNCKGVIFLEQ